MKELLFYFNQKRYLELGDKQFSPIMKTSVGVALDYCDNTQSKKTVNSPLFLCFPDKKEASLWLSLGILRNYFVNDYIDNATKSIGFKAGQNVCIYGCIAKVITASDQGVNLMFKGGEEVFINKLHWSNISLADPKRVLNLYKNYIEKKREYRAGRNSISKILEPKESVVINQDNLDSKVILVSGRGNVHHFKGLLGQISIHDEPLSKTFSVDDNIIITTDLKSYSQIFNSDYQERLDKFKNLLYKLIGVMQQEELKEIVLKFYQNLEKEMDVTFEFDNSFRDFVNNYLSVIPKLQFVYNIYPGLKEAIPSKLRAVVINDIRQVEDYENTIKAFLDQKIPVIIISDRNIAISKDIDFYNCLFSENPHYYRLNWNRKKIKALMDYETETSYLDMKLWQQCKRYAQQVINLDVYPPHELDKLLPQVVGWIKELDDFEVFQKSFYNFLYPALFCLKNSQQSNFMINSLVKNFKTSFELVEHQIKSKEIIDGFKKVISLAESFNINTKSYSESKNLFSTETVLNDGSKLKIPLDTLSINTPTFDTKEIIFTGYPYNEYFGRYLIDSINILFVPKVVITCWPEEANLTYRYLKKRIKGGYFLDNLGDMNRFNNQYLLKSEENIDKEIESYLNTSKHNSLEVIDEETLDYLHTFKYRGYQVGKEEQHIFTTPCNIVNLQDGFFMFLPVGSTILGQSEDNKGQLRVAKLKIDDLNIGDRVFTIIANRGLYRKLSKSNKELGKHFDKLELWREILHSLYLKCDGDLKTLENRLKAIKRENNFKAGNPVKSSIQRWLFDEEMLSPEIDNLRIILKAADVSKLEVVLEEINFAYKSVASFTISLSSEIRKSITHKLSNHNSDSNVFIFDIDGMTFHVYAKQITSIDNNKIEVEYSNTRRFLC
ncbi:MULTISPECIES: hypothetical protein [Sphingobacterium]|uniref:hypothetical protein n=1 Tax=Sphingobacterium TaxID=28453 RepID=UPI00257B6386|nr:MULTISPECIES: hypothetical protein [Sphingobacterium]